LHFICFLQYNIVIRQGREILDRREELEDKEKEMDE
jgi:hypothetical protein